VLKRAQSSHSNVASAGCKVAIPSAEVHCLTRSARYFETGAVVREKERMNTSCAHDVDSAYMLYVNIGIKLSAIDVKGHQRS